MVALDKAPIIKWIESVKPQKISPNPLQKQEEPTESIS